MKNGAFEEKCLAPELGIVDVVDDLIVHRDLRMTVAFRLDAWHEPGMSDEDFNRTAQRAEDVWGSGLPENTSYQFLVVVDQRRGIRGVEAALPSIAVADGDRRAEVLEEFRRARLAELTRAEAGGRASVVQDRRHFLCATFRPPSIKGLRRRGPLGWLRGRAARVERAAEPGDVPGRSYQEALAEAKRFATRVEYALRQMGLGFERCDTGDLVSLLYELLNPTASRALDLRALPARLAERRVEWPKGILEELPYLEQASPIWSLAEDDLVVRRRYLELGDRCVGVVALKSLPDTTEPGCVVPLLQLARCPRYVVSYQVEIPDQEAALRRIRSNAQLASALSFGSLWVKTDRKDALASAVEAQSDQAMQAVIESTFRILGVSLAVALYESSPEALEEGVEEVMAAMSRAHGMRGVRETYALKPAFLELLPGSPPLTDRRRIVLSPNGVDMMPCFDFRSGHAGRGVPMLTPSNSVVFVDPFDTTTSANANVLVVGTSGSGKSFLVSMLVSGYQVSAAANDDPPVYTFILDNGDSYGRYARLVGGKYVPFSFEQPPGIDIFEWDTSWGTLDEHVSRLSWLLVDLLRVNPRDEERLERVTAVIERALKELYEGGGARSFAGFREALLSVGGRDVEDLAQVLRRYVDGALARLFQPNPLLAMHEDVHVLCYDFKDLAGHKDVASLALKLVIYQVRRWAARVSRRRHRTFLVLDESWALLDAGSGGEAVAAAAAPFIGASVRMGRKEGMSVVGLSQELGDYLESSYGKAVVSNSATKFIGQPGGGGVEVLRQHLRLTERQVEQVRGLRRTNRYHEFLMLRGERSDVVRVPGDSFSRWVFSTSPRDRDRIAQLALESPEMSLLDQVRLLAAEG